MPFEDYAHWAEVGISRPELNGSSPESPGDPHARVLNAFQLPDHYFGFQLELKRGEEKEEHYMLVRFVRQDEVVDGNSNFELSFHWLTAEHPEQEAPPCLQQASTEALQLAGQEECWKKIGARRIDLEHWLREELENLKKLELIYVFQIAHGHFCLRLRQRCPQATEFTTQAVYETEAEGYTFHASTPKLEDAEAQDQLTQVVETLGQVHLDQQLSIDATRRRIDLLGPVYGRENLELEGYVIVDGGVVTGQHAWMKVRTVLSDETNAEFFVRVRFEGMSEAGNPSYNASVATQDTSFIEGRDAPLHDLLHHAAACIEDDRRAAAAERLEQLEGMEDSFSDTVWGTDGSPKEQRSTLKLVEARSGRDGSFFFRFELDTESRRSAEFISAMCINVSFDEDYEETFQFPLSISDRGQLYLAIRRILSRVRKMLFRASNEGEPVRRPEFENITVKMEKAHGAERDIKVRTIECLDFGDNELHITVELTSDLSGDLTALTAFRNFSFAEGGSKCELRILVPSLDDHEAKAMSMLANEVATRVYDGRGPWS